MIVSRADGTPLYTRAAAHLPARPACPVVARPEAPGRLHRAADGHRPGRQRRRRRGRRGGAAGEEGEAAEVGCGAGHGPADHPLHRQGRRRQDLRGGRHGEPLRRGGPAHARALDGSGPLPGRRAGGQRRLRPTEVAGGLWAQQVSAQEELERHWSAVRSWLAAVLVDRGVDRIAAEELTVPPGGDELFSLLELKRHVEGGELGRDRGRLRADGRDAAPAVLPRRGALVARQAARSRGAAARGRAPARARVPGPVAAGRGRRDGGTAPRGQPRGHARTAARPPRGLPAASS